MKNSLTENDHFMLEALVPFTWMWLAIMSFAKMYFHLL